MKHSHRTGTVLVTAAGMAGMGLLIPVAAQAAGQTQQVEVIHGHLVESSDIGWPTGYVSMDKDYGPNGKQIGSDVTTCRASSPTATQARCDASLGLRQGLITFSFTESSRPGPIQGTVTSGTGAYGDATGTVRIIEGANGKGPSTANWTITLHRAG